MHSNSSLVDTHAVARRPSASRHGRAAQQDPLWVRCLLIGAAVAVIGVLVLIPVVNVFYQALADGFGAYWKNLFEDAGTRNSVLLTLVVAPVAVVMNICGRFLNREMFGVPMNMVLQYLVPILSVPALMLFKYGKQRGYLLDWVLFHTKPHVYSALERDRELTREYIKD